MEVNEPLMAWPCRANRSTGTIPSRSPGFRHFTMFWRIKSANPGAP